MEAHILQLQKRRSSPEIDVIKREHTFFCIIASRLASKNVLMNKEKARITKIPKKLRNETITILFFFENSFER